MPEFDLDSLKNQWQEQSAEKKYGDREILGMLNKKSRNYVKYIFYISLAEFLFILILNLYYLFQGNDLKDFMHLLQKLGAADSERYRTNFTYFYNVAKVTSLVVTCYFVIIFYISYKKIHVEQNLKAFNVHIMKFRKIVNVFILLNIFLMILFLGFLTAFIAGVITNEQIVMDTSTLTGFITGIIVSCILCVVLLWLYYRLVYGILMGRLGRNLKQLKEIEENTEN